MLLHAPLQPPTCAAITRAPGPLLQRKCACGGTPGPTGECESCRKKREAGMLQRKANDSGTHAHASAVPPIVHDVLSSPGQPLDTSTRAYMEPRFSHDFSQVRVHTNDHAAASAKSVQAHAYTVGSDIVFGQGKYRPATPDGRRLLVHELTHVVQQAAGPRQIQTKLAVAAADSAPEREADHAVAAIEAGGNFRPVRMTGPEIARQPSTCGPDEFTYGEIRQWAIKNVGKPYDGSAPAGLDDAKESIGAACARNTHSSNCNCVDGSTATQKGDQDAWNNIVSASGGTDQSGGGNFMCVGSQNCRFVHVCGDIRTGKPVARATKLNPSGTVTIKGHQIFFYNDPLNGMCPPKAKSKGSNKKSEKKKKKKSGQPKPKPSPRTSEATPASPPVPPSDGFDPSPDVDTADFNDLPGPSLGDETAESEAMA